MMTMMMRMLALAAILAGPALIAPAQAGSCDHSWQSAKDGSRCGDRAADRREGGKYR